jgi:hypothetical protein
MIFHFANDWKTTNKKLERNLLTSKAIRQIQHCFLLVKLSTFTVIAQTKQDHHLKVVRLSLYWVAVEMKSWYLKVL